MSLPDEKEPTEAHKNSLENLESRLYSRTPPPLRHDEEFIGEEKHVRIAPGWTSEAEREHGTVYTLLSATMPWLKGFFIASIIFFLFAAGVVLYGFFRGSNTVSPQHISITIDGPVGTGAGEEVPIEISVDNDNSVDLASVSLRVEFPDGTKKPENLSESLLRYFETLGPLSAGGHISRTLSFVPYGEEGETKKIVITAEYRSKDSNAIYSKKADYDLLISSAPVTVTLGIPKEVNSDQTFEIEVGLSSNTSALQEDLLLKAEYPFGFQFVESTPEPSFGKDGWLIGDLQPQGKRTVRIKGKIQATDESERTFRFSVGTQSKKDERQLGTTFLTEAPTIAVRKPFLTLDLLVNNGKGKTFIAKSGQTIRADIVWGNNLPVKIADLEISAELNGDIYSKENVSANGGFYDSTTGTVLWNKQKTARFGVVEPGENGTLSFSFGTLSVATDPSAFKNPQMSIVVTAKGKRLDEQGLYQDVTSSVTKDIKIATALSLSSRLLHDDGLFTNTGSIPPKAEEETTYTVVWALSNTSNGVANTRVSAVLPSYVKWLGQVSPSSEDITYSPVGGELVWKAGEVESGDGVGTPPREVSFQVSFTPSQSQIGTTPTLVGETTAKGTDRFTGVETTSGARQALTTGLLSDSGATANSGKVAK